MEPAPNVSEPLAPVRGPGSEHTPLYVERRAVRRASGPAAAGARRRRPAWIVLAVAVAVVLAGLAATAGTTSVVVALLAVVGAQLAGLVTLWLRAGHMTRLAHRDELTSLGNSRALWDDFNTLLQTTGVGLAIIDLDHFKQINDEHGHGVGDAVLRAVGSTLPAITGASARCYRYGGEELVVLLPGADEETAAAVAERIRARVAVGFPELPAVTMSAGVTAAMAGAPSRSVFDRADDALRQAKLSGRDRVVLSTSLEALAAVDDTSTLAARRAALAIAMAALEARDSDTADHSDDVVLLCEAIAARLGISGTEREHLLAAARLHDIGKVAIPHEILDKPGPLDDAEWEVMRQHTITGERILRSVPELEDIAPIVRSAHERYDGTGYPDGLAGEEIPLASRVILCSDAFHAIRSDRPYRKSQSPEIAARELEEHAGSQFDPVVAATLVDVVRDANHPRRGSRRSLGISPRLAALLVAAAAGGTAIAAVPPLRHALERIVQRSKPAAALPAAPLAPGAPVSCATLALHGTPCAGGGVFAPLAFTVRDAAASAPRATALRGLAGVPVPGARGVVLPPAPGDPALVAPGASEVPTGSPVSGGTVDTTGVAPSDGTTAPSDGAPRSGSAGQSGDAPGQGGSSPGQSENAPGQGGESPGQSGNAPGHGGPSPGNSGSAPGHSDGAPGKSGNAPGQTNDPPGNSGDAPGQTNDPPGNSGNTPGQTGSPGNSGNAPGQSNQPPEPPEQTGSSPGNSGEAPGQSQTPPGQGNGGNGNGGGKGKGDAAPAPADG